MKSPRPSISRSLSQTLHPPKSPRASISNQQAKSPRASLPLNSSKPKDLPPKPTTWSAKTAINMKLTSKKLTATKQPRTRKQLSSTTFVDPSKDSTPSALEREWDLKVQEELMKGGTVGVSSMHLLLTNYREELDVHVKC